MRLVLYNWKSDPVVYYIEDKPIDFIYVTVISGDEVIMILYKDGSFKALDADEKELRDTDNFDGGYVVKHEDIERWMHWIPDDGDNPFWGYAYSRMSDFTE